DKTPSGIIRFAALFHDLKPETIQSLTQRYRIPNEYTDLAILLSRFGSHYTKIHEMDEKALLDFILKTDALRRSERFEQFLFACESVYATSTNRPRIEKAIRAIKSIDIKPLQEKQLKGEAFAKALKKQRLETIRNLIGNDS
ncbi:MAG TPA: multifunctional CCA tRNA nucleotidyl transferase/2'3'-cyclic phosphodiesterase/2'nucleotidase/phosphatase, partial [Gammaproteobacteria bacterium]|nr:multifunctional CCA tRNA nucleotidyl transferase/2'3'-cyclic phosphodiesterase/2'nucleotidase/phosphatase [Gammaproteobacteria bacterium]